MRLALVTDIHFGPKAHFAGKLRKLSHLAGESLKQALSDVQQRGPIDLFVNLGDVLEDESAEADRKRYQEFLDIFASAPGPQLHVAGNHDTKFLSASDLCALWGHAGEAFHSFDQQGLHFVVLHTHERKDVDVRLPQEQLDWLRTDLAATALPTVVLVHHPLADMRLTGNRWFERRPELCLVQNRAQVRAVLEASGKVRAVFNGHAHWNCLTVHQGIPYVTLQSLTENVDDDAPGRAARAAAVVDVSEQGVFVDVLGEQPTRYQFAKPEA